MGGITVLAEIPAPSKGIACTFWLTLRNIPVRNYCSMDSVMNKWSHREVKKLTKDTQLVMANITKWFVLGWESVCLGSTSWLCLLAHVEYFTSLL